MASAAAARLIGLLALVGACQPAADRFPCSDRGTCPDGYACARDRLCHRGGAPIRLLAPLSTAIVTSQRPMLRWEPAVAPPVTVTVDICRDRGCARPIVSFSATGGSARPPAPLPAGVVFWRVTATSPPAATTPSWQMTVPARDAGRATAWGAVPDFDGDGFADLAIAARPPGRAGTVQIFRGGPGGPAPTPDQILSGDAELGAAVAAAGDLNGDGRGDLAVSSSRGAGAVWVYLGGEEGLSAPVALDPGPVTRGFGASISAAGDVDGDGYGDLLVDGLEAAQLFRGGADGVQPTAALVLRGMTPPVGALPGGQLVCGGADFDGDGWPDALVGLQSGGALYLGTGETLAYRATARALPAGRMAGDVDGDGRSDFASYAVYPGGAAGPELDTVLLNFPGVSFQAGAGDVNGDGFADVIAAVSPQVGVREMNRVYLGGPTACIDDRCATFVPLPYPGGTNDGPFEAAVLAGVGDLNGDGFADLAAATPSSGNVYLFFGGPAGPAAAPSLTLTGEPGLGAALAGL